MRGGGVVVVTCRVGVRGPRGRARPGRRHRVATGCHRVRATGPGGCRDAQSRIELDIFDFAPLYMDVASLHTLASADRVT